MISFIFVKFISINISVAGSLKLVELFNLIKSVNSLVIDAFIFSSVITAIGIFVFSSTNTVVGIFAVSSANIVVGIFVVSIISV